MLQARRSTEAAKVSLFPALKPPLAELPGLVAPGLPGHEVLEQGLRVQISQAP